MGVVCSFVTLSRHSYSSPPFALRHFVTLQAMLPAYAELHCVTNFSFLRGASHAEELVARAHALGYGALAITDECSVAGVVRAHVAAKALNEQAQAEGKPRLKLIVGTEVRIENGPRLVLLATHRASYGALCALVTRAR